MSRLISLIFLALPLYLVRFDVAGVPSTLLELLIYAVFLAAFVQGRWWQSPRRPRLGRTNLIAIGLLLAGGVVSLLVTPDLRAGLGLFKGFLIDPLLVFILLLQSRSGPQAKKESPSASAFWRWVHRSDTAVSHIDLYWRAYLVSALVLAGWGITQYLWASTTGYRAHGPFESPNYLAFYLVPAALYLISRLLQASRPLLYLHSAEFAILVGALLLTGSRGGYIGLAAGLLVWVPTLFSRLSMVARTAAAFAMGGGILTIFLALEGFSSRITTSDDIRKLVWSRSWELIQAHPLTGTGLGGFHHAMTHLSWPILDVGHQVARDVSNAHNLYLVFWLNLGILGLLGLLWLVGITALRVWRRQDNLLAIGALAALAGILAHGLVDTPVWKNDLFPIFWLIIATPLLLDRRATKESQ